MAATKSTTFVLVPGAFHRPMYLDVVTGSLLQLGYRSIVVPLQTVGAGPACDSFQPDVDNIYATVRGIVELGGDAIVVAHSYGGVPATEAVGKLVQELQETGKPHGQIKLVFVASYVLLKGQSLASVGTEPYDGQVPPPTLMGADFGETHCTVNAQARKEFYRDLPTETADKLRDALEPHSLMSFLSPITQVGWEMVPSSYVFASEDGAISIALKQFMVERARKEFRKNNTSPEPFSGELGTLTLKTGHFGPYYTHAAELTEFLDKVARSG